MKRAMLLLVSLLHSSLTSSPESYINLSFSRLQLLHHLAHLFMTIKKYDVDHDGCGDRDGGSDDNDGGEVTDGGGDAPI